MCCPLQQPMLDIDIEARCFWLPRFLRQQENIFLRLTVIQGGLEGWTTCVIWHWGVDSSTMVFADKMVLGEVGSTPVQGMPEWPDGAKISFWSNLPKLATEECCFETAAWGILFNPLSTFDTVALWHCSGVSSAYGISCVPAMWVSTVELCVICCWWNNWLWSPLPLQPCQADDALWHLAIVWGCCRCEAALAWWIKLKNTIYNSITNRFIEK